MVEANEEQQTVKLPCRDCGRKTPVTIAWLRKHGKFACAGCGTANNADLRKILLELPKAQGRTSDQVK